MDLQPIIDRVVQLGTRWQAISGRLTWALSQARQQTSGWSVVRPVVNTELPILGGNNRTAVKGLEDQQCRYGSINRFEHRRSAPTCARIDSSSNSCPPIPNSFGQQFSDKCLCLLATNLVSSSKPHVDRLACAWLSIYFPATHQFLIQPQHTFRALAPEDIQKIIRDWSIRADVGQDSFKFELDSDFDGNVGSTSTPISTRNEGMHTHSEESPEDDSEVFMQFKLPIDAHPPVDFSHVPLQPMNSDDFFNQSEPPSVLPPGMTIDSVLRAVEIANNELKRPDVSLVFQNIPSLMHLRMEHFPGD
ncbi:hypothetical protein R3P38DRAFT_3415638 [Favolaschia claudopus]|uniref:Uncharacterized protein n=1 Tax=Favolaschia claudopus TaxID=2862362 RepID=A0AAW0EDI0_9AGAR